MLKEPRRTRPAARPGAAAGPGPSPSGRARGGAAALGRERLSAALRRCAARERQLLALILVERLSPAEAARALGISVGRLERCYRGVLDRLRRVAARAPLPAAGRRGRTAPDPERVRRAS